MSDVRFAPVDAPERETLREPVKPWRNWWRIIVKRDAPDPHCRVPNEVGALYPSVRVYPSRDVAETCASKALARDIALFGKYLDEYLGAFPDGERP